MSNLCKANHSTFECWHRLDLQYQPQPPSPTGSPSMPHQSKAFSTTIADASTSQPSSPWFLDFAAVDHVTNGLHHLNSYQPYKGSDQVIVGNGFTLPIYHTGKGQAL